MTVLVRPQDLETLNVRLALTRDMRAIAGIARAAACGPTSEVEASNWQSHLTHLMFVATWAPWHRQSGEVIGFACWSVRAMRYTCRAIAVRDDLRGFGVGRALVSRMKARVLASRQPRSIRADVDEMDDLAIAFFGGLGFRARLLRGREGKKDTYRFTWRHEEE